MCCQYIRTRKIAALPPDWDEANANYLNIGHHVPVLLCLDGVIWRSFCAEILHLLPASITLINHQISKLWLERYKFSLFKLITFVDLDPVCYV